MQWMQCKGMLSENCGVPAGSLAAEGYRIVNRICGRAEKEDKRPGIAYDLQAESRWNQQVIPACFFLCPGVFEKKALQKT